MVLSTLVVLQTQVLRPARGAVGRMVAAVGTAGVSGGSAGVLPKSNPDPNALPGGAELAHLVSGLEFWALMISLIGLLLGAIVWAIGAHSQNFHQSVNGRKAVIVSAVAALLVGAGPSLLNWFFSFGSSINAPIK